MTQRVIDQEPDTIALVPDFPDFVIIGTYSLISKEGEGAPAARKGSLQIVAFSEDSKQTSVTLDRKDFDFGVYDINFHPRYRNVLGIATSDGQILIYCVRSTIDSTGQLRNLTLQEIGRLAGEEDGGSGPPGVIITQLHFIDHCSFETLTTDQSKIPHRRIFLIAVTTQSGNTNLIRTCVTTTDSLSDAKVESEFTQLRVIHSQSYDLEAWTVLCIPVEASSASTTREPALQNILAISGGDDSQLLVSQVELEHRNSTVSINNDAASFDLDEVTCSKFAADKRSHEAGIVATCLLGPDLPQFSDLAKGSYMFLTGSYDEKIRLFQLKLPEINHGRCEVKVLSEFAMPGGVWRIMLLDCYKYVHDVNCLLLIAGHTAGAFIVRLTCTPPNDNFAEVLGSWQYSWKIEKHFTQHQSLVYAVAARPRREQRGKWQVISTSFYDKLVCEWEWEDCEWRSRHPAV